MSLRLAGLWSDGSSPVVKVGLDSGPPLRVAGNLASNVPTSHVPGKALSALQDQAPVMLLDKHFEKIIMPQAAQMLKTRVNMAPEWKLRRHLQSSIADTCILS